MRGLQHPLGSRTESALQDWYDGAVRAHFASDTRPEPFARDRILMLRTEEDEVVMLMEKSSPEDESPLGLLTDPHVQMHVQVPRPAEYMTGVLKSVYLASCLHFGGAAHTPSMKCDHDGEVTYLVSLAGTILVEWPFDDLDRLLSPRMQAS